MPKDKGAYVEQYPLAQADKQGVAGGKGANVETGIAVELEVPTVVDNEPARKPLKNTAPTEDPRQV